MKIERLLAGVLGIAMGIFSLPSTAAAASYYLHTNQTSSSNWHTVAAAQGWYDAPTGGSQLAVFDATGHYFNNGFNLRTPPSADAPSVFGGRSLTMSGALLQLRSSGNTISNLTSLGTTIVNAVSATATVLNITQFSNQGTTTVGDHEARAVTLNIGTLTGSGNLVSGGSSSGATLNLSIADAANFTGSFNHVAGRLNFNSDFTSGGGLALSLGTFVTLDQAVTFTSLSIAGDVLGAGEYSYAYLNANYGAIFDLGTAAGFITVAPIPEPQTWALLAIGLGAWFFHRPGRRRSACRPSGP